MHDEVMEQNPPLIYKSSKASNRTQRLALTRFELIIFVFLLNGVPCRSQSVPTPSQQENAIESGEKQLDRILQDRPQLQPIVPKGNAIWKWLQAAFANTSEGFQINWDSGPTSDFTPDSSEYILPGDSKTAYIRIDRAYKTGPSKGAERSSEEVLSNLVFELNNVKHWTEKQNTAHFAESGKISRDDYIRSCFRTERSAAQETAVFYRTVWVPFCKSKGLQFTPRLWYSTLPATFEEDLSQFPRDSWYPWKYYGDIYDWITAQRDGDSKFNRGDLDGAIAAYTLALNLGPRPYYKRGLAEMEKGDWDQALADIRQNEKLTLDKKQPRDCDHFLFWLIQVQQGKKAQAYRELSNYFATRPASTQIDWASKISMFLLDQLREKDFLASAFSSDSKSSQGLRCAVWYYVGMKHLLAGDKVIAKTYFRDCMTINQTSLMEYELARDELRTLGQTN